MFTNGKAISTVTDLPVTGKSEYPEKTGGSFVCSEYSIIGADGLYKPVYGWYLYNLKRFLNFAKMHIANRANINKIWKT